LIDVLREVLYLPSVPG